MKIRKITFYILCVFVGFVSCSKDDGPSVEVVELRDRTEQQIIDKDSLIGYLNTHYYNSSVFVGNPNPSINDLVITELADGETVPANHTLLMTDIETKTTVLVLEDEDVTYEYYILRLNQGGGDSKPNFTDDVRVNFSGNTLDEEVFDSSSNPIDFDLTTLVPGWSRVLPEFNVAFDFDEVGDGTISFTNAGVGVMFLPSGLGFFSNASGSIPAYSPLIFRFELYQTDINDHDLDGIPTYFEDINSDLNINNDDTDGNTVPNFADGNDDGDTVLTINELEHKEYVVDTNLGETEPVLGNDEFEINRSEDNGIITINTVKIVDSNNDGLGDYLDPDIEVINSEN